MISLVTKAQVEEAYWDGFMESFTFDTVSMPGYESREAAYQRPSEEDPVSSAYWMGMAAGTVSFTGGYAALQMSPLVAGTAAAEGTFFSHIGLLAYELGLATARITPPVLVIAAAASLAQAGLTLGLGDYRERMSEHKSYYDPMTQRKMR